MPSLNRAEISKLFPGNPKAVISYDELQRQVATNATTGATNVASTVELQNATAITLSPNDALVNERILNVGDGLTIIDNGAGSTVVIGLEFLITLLGGYPLTFNLLADTNLTLPTDGRVIVDSDISYLSAGPFANDAAAATGGIAVGQIYKKTGGDVVWRQV